MRALRSWSVQHARPLKRLFDVWMAVLATSAPAWRWMGRHRAQRFVGTAERIVKGLLFDCSMCGQCMLGEAGLSCPMNCPKQMRNGPCGGVRPEGTCELDPARHCVWVAAWEGSRRLDDGHAMLRLQPPLDRRLQGQSAWLAAAGGMTDPDRGVPVRQRQQS